MAGIWLELLYWYDAQGDRHLASDEWVEQEYQRAEQEYQRAERECQEKEQLKARLRAMGIDPDQILSS
jgi:hypothetical protein